MTFIISHEFVRLLSNSADLGQAYLYYHVSVVSFNSVFLLTLVGFPHV